MKLYENTKFLEGIASTNSFLEDLFCSVVCIDAKVICLYECSKTLGFTVAMKNMKGQDSASDFYNGLSYVHSRESTDT